VRKKTVRWAAILAVLLAAVLALAACGGSGKGGDGDDAGGSGAGNAAATADAPKSGTTIRLWIMNNGPHPVQDTEKILKPFEQQTGIHVKVELVGWDVQFDRIRNAAVSGEGPDVTQAGTTQVPFFAALGGFSDLSDRVGEIGGASAYAPGIWGTTQVIGRDGTWAVPWFTEARTIYYRTDALKQAGVDPRTAFTDWDALHATLQKLKSVKEIGGKPIMPFGLPGKKAFDLVHSVMPFVWDAGGSELTPDDKKSAIASPEAQKGVDFLADLLPEGLWDPSMLERDGTQVENQYKAGRLAVWIGGPWVLQSIGRADDTNWSDAARHNTAIAPMPEGPSGKAYTFIGGSDLMVLKSSEPPAEAWALIKYLSQDSVQKQYADLMGMFPARLAPQEQVGQQDADHKAFYEAIKTGRSYAPIPQWAQVENTYKSHFGAILDMAAGHGDQAYTHEAVAKELQAAQTEADGLLAQGTG
jgi:multiple sugar transport system substrate-binding protein